MDNRKIVVILGSKDISTVVEYETIEEAHEFCEEYVYEHEGEPFYLWSGYIRQDYDRNKEIKRANMLYWFEKEWARCQAAK